jgi:hypothetical protein
LSMAAWICIAITEQLMTLGWICMP